FVDKARSAGITVPIAAGIMPILEPSQILRMTTMSGSSIPYKLSHIIARYNNDVNSFRAAGLDYATKQITQLIEQGVDGLHLYTMNRPKTTERLLQNVGLR
ncbi:methylenetetrahydrofolate reductase, partial [Eubacteriales bacterium OttesenSCG-928-N14]|nr:methylenetetrahydrofolate reductase [Eubacteriales bacterium OttesenSCG-928-N14]